MLVQESGESQLLHEVEGWGARGREVAGALVCTQTAPVPADFDVGVLLEAMLRRRLHPAVCTCTGGSECVLANAALPPALPEARALPAFPSREQQSLVAARWCSECGSLRDLLAALASAKHSSKPSLSSQAHVRPVKSIGVGKQKIHAPSFEDSGLSWKPRCSQKSE